MSIILHEVVEKCFNQNLFAYKTRCFEWDESLLNRLNYLFTNFNKVTEQLSNVDYFNQQLAVSALVC